MTELVTLMMDKAGQFGVLIAVLWLFRNYVRISFDFGKPTKE